MSYGTPPFGTLNQPQSDMTPPAVSQTGPQDSVQDTGAFKVTLTTPIWAERGATQRLKFYAEHVVDGVITAYTTGPAFAVLDRGGLAVLTSYITAGAVTADPGASGRWYSDVTVNTIAPQDAYVAEWTATYTPKGGGPALPLRFRRTFRVQVTRGPSQFYFTPTGEF